MKTSVLLLSGASEGPLLARALLDAGFGVVATVTREEGRHDWEPPEGTVYCTSYAEAAERLPSLGTRAMLTIDAKQLKHFAYLHSRLWLCARLLPAPASIQQALDAGFTQAHIVTMRPPVSKAVNASLYREYR